MAQKRNTSGLIHWRPGQSGNPSGKPKQAFTAEQISSMIGSLSVMPRSALEAIIKNPQSSMLELMVASIMARATKDGDYSRLDFLLQRTIGKVKDKVEVSAKPTMTIHRPDGTTLELTQGDIQHEEPRSED